MLGNVLKGCRVVDLTQNVAGPFCTQILGDFGADIIKIERPGRGDDTRDWRPPDHNGVSATFLALNRNKRSLCADLTTAGGRQVVLDLAVNSDVLIHAMKPGSAEKLGLGYEDLKAVNPRLVYCAISAFGQTGELSPLPGYDPLMQAFTGLMSTTGNEGEAPVRLGVSLVDMGTGMWSAMGVLAAILKRTRSGEGCMVEASLLDTGLTWMSIVIAGYLATKQLPKKLGSAIAMTAPYELFRCADAHVFVAAGNNGLFARVCKALGRPELIEDPRFSSNSARVNHREELHATIEATTVRWQAAELLRALRENGAPCSELNNVAQALDEEQVKASEILFDLPTPAVPDLRVVALPIKAKGRRSDRKSPPPSLGADTEAVLSAIGYDERRIAMLRASGAIA